MNFLSSDDVIVIHDLAIKTFGGSSGVRERGLLDSIVAKPLASFDGHDLYPDLFSKTAAVYEGFCKFHVFVDGNKRTAALVMYRMLTINGYDLTASNKELEEFTLKVAENHLDLVVVADWVKSHSNQTSRL